MATEPIGTLDEEHLSIWREVQRRIWIMGTPDNSWNENEKINAYNARINFLLNMVNFFGIDDYRPWYVSEVTGTIYYTDDGGDNGEQREGEDRPHGMDQGNGSESERSERRTERDSDER